MSQAILRAIQRSSLVIPRSYTRKGASASRVINLLDSAKFSTSSYLRDRLYSKQHEWISIDGNVGKVGISHYAQEALGDVVFVQLLDVGTEVNQGGTLDSIGLLTNIVFSDEVGTVESVKAASEAYTPVSGRIVEINKTLEEKPGLVNTSCYDEGWLFKLECTKPEELKSLMSEEQYQHYLKTVKD